jgi:hypothetical protein
MTFLIGNVTDMQELCILNQWNLHENLEIHLINDNDIRDGVV